MNCGTEELKLQQAAVGYEIKSLLYPGLRKCLLCLLHKSFVGDCQKFGIALNYNLCTVPSITK